MKFEFNIFHVYINLEKPKEKKRKSRWGDESQKVIIPGLPTILPANMTELQNQLYLS